jgi:hypothetical protein
LVVRLFQLAAPELVGGVGETGSLELNVSVGFEGAHTLGSVAHG